MVFSWLFLLQKERSSKKILFEKLLEKTIPTEDIISLFFLTIFFFLVRMSNTLVTRIFPTNKDKGKKKAQERLEELVNIV